MQSLDALEVQVLDQVVYRFGRLQDALATRLLPATLHLLAEWQESEPFLDKLHRAEKLTIIPSAEEWAVFREVRNQISHEYPDQSEKVLQNLQYLVSLTPGLLALHQHMTDFIHRRFST
ncbi:MAG: hypothetical protein G8345_00125 [Magnetococcales bacterium]|nr:hypothetical protein [Magnetococcales bacterium]NGZ25272.1 hypothetical protein [Magnetococcales bacterium]